MKFIDYSPALTLEQAHEIDRASSVWDENIQSRFEMLQRCANDSEVNTIAEFGVYRGSSFIQLIMCKPKKIIGVDPDLSRYRNDMQRLTDHYAKQHNIEIEMIQAKSDDKKSVREVDMLHIDSFHKAWYLKKELALHANHVSKYIAFHDIKQNNWELWRVIEQFVNNNPEWEVESKYEGGKCGYAVIKRK